MMMKIAVPEELMQELDNRSFLARYLLHHRIPLVAARHLGLQNSEIVARVVNEMMRVSAKIPGILGYRAVCAVPGGTTI